MKKPTFRVRRLFTQNQAPAGEGLASRLNLTGRCLLHPKHT
jgi:hypothetical protein